MRRFHLNTKESLRIKKIMFRYRILNNDHQYKCLNPNVTFAYSNCKLYSCNFLLFLYLLTPATNICSKPRWTYFRFDVFFLFRFIWLGKMFPKPKFHYKPQKSFCGTKSFKVIIVCSFMWTIRNEGHFCGSSFRSNAFMNMVCSCTLNYLQLRNRLIPYSVKLNKIHCKRFFSKP